MWPMPGTAGAALSCPHFPLPSLSQHQSFKHSDRKPGGVLEITRANNNKKTNVGFMKSSLKVR